MASQFYARYIPPVPLASHDSTQSKKGVTETLKDSKKRKRKRNPEIDSAETPKQLKAKDVCPEPVQPSQAIDVKFKQGGDYGSIVEGIPQGDHSSDLLKSEIPPNLSAQLSKSGEVRSLKRSKRPNEAPKSVEDKDNIGSAKAVEVSEDGTPDHETKHRKIRSKFEKSTKIASKLIQIDKASVLPSDNQEHSVQASVQAPVQTHGLVPFPQPPENNPTTSVQPSSALPQWFENPVTVPYSHTVPFEDLHLSPSTIASLKAKGYNNALAIQTVVIPMLLGVTSDHVEDICISAATGSGKTLAYTLPMVESLKNRPVRHLRGLVVVPTRELVRQVRETLQICIGGTSLKIGTAVGSKTLKEEQDLLVQKCQKYDPEGFQREHKKQLDEDNDLMDWQLDQREGSADSLNCPVDFVIEYTSGIDILICTPGRLIDHIKSTKGFTLDHVQWLIIDEADRLLDESFQQWVDVIFPALEIQPELDPRTEKLLSMLHMREKRYVRKIILSATMTKDISKLIALKLRRPRLVALENEHSTSLSDLATANNHKGIDLPATLIETAISIQDVREKPLYLLKILSTQENQPEAVNSTLRSTRSTLSNSGEETSSSDDDSSSDTSASSVGSGYEISKPLCSKLATQRIKYNLDTTISSTHGTLIFANSNESAMRLARLLCLLRPSSAKKIGSLTKSTATSAGRRTLTSFQKRQLTILVASDRASRGLDIQDLAEVINYDMPTSLTSYIHRVGRTARAGKPGSAKTLVAHHEARWFWNEIARSEQINRPVERKVNRIDWKSDSIDNKDRIAFEIALAKLGEEARGEKV